MLLTPAQIKPKSFESRPKYFSPGVDASHVYMGAWALGCFHSLISTKTFWRVLTKSGTAWRKAPESDAGRVGYSMFPVICCCNHQLLLLAECQINTNPGTASGRQGADTLGYSLFPVICCCDHQLLLLAERPCTEF